MSVEGGVAGGLNFVSCNFAARFLAIVPVQLCLVMFDLLEL